MRKDSLHAVPLLALTFGLAAFCGLQPALAQDNTMYKWTDENGVVHFSDQAPPGQNVQAQQLPESPKPGSVSPLQADEAAAAPAGQQPSVAQQRRDQIAAKSADARAQQDQTQAQCAVWRAELERLEPNRRVYYTNDEGETERMDDVVRTDRVAELHKAISENCD